MKQLNPPLLSFIKYLDRNIRLISYLLFSDGYIGLNSFGFGGSNGHVILKPFKRKRKEMGLSICQMFHIVEY